MNTRVWPGQPYPLGASWDGAGVNFALFSEHAEKVELCLFDRSGRRELERIVMPEYTDQVWHAYLPDCRVGDLYAYRVYGPYQPEQGHRFNPHKLLLDPYARQLKGMLRWSHAHYAYRVGSPRADLSFDRRDNARLMPKCVVIDPAFSWDGDRPPRTPWSDTVIYETHTRGFTIRHDALSKDQRGTFRGLTHAEIINYLKALGVTAVELLPVHAFVDDHFLINKGLRNYWGYSTLGFFAPEPRYLGAYGLSNFKTMVRRLHDAGIEVLLDVVYNHTAEGDHMGPTLSFRGIDNASYYRLLPDDPRHYINDTGCGNTLNITHPRVLQMVLDSLRYWVNEMHVDGFRFDLASILGRELHGFDPGSGFFDAVRQDPVLAQVKLIAEPWDVGPGGYQLGHFPPGWAEWNDRYRDTIRRFWRGDEGMLPELARRLHGSSDLFEHHGRRSWASINFVTSHDGFSLQDLVSYRERHNEANGEDNRDGHHSNFSDHYGVEGPTDDAEINAIRDRQRRNLLATLLLSQGTPMLLAGDELGHTQNGNNNAYCQDNETSWLDWSRLDKEHDLLTFVRHLIQLRRSHPVLRRSRFLHGRHQSKTLAVPDVVWLHENGSEMSAEHWHEPQRRWLGLLLAGDAGQYHAYDGTPLTDATLLIVFNAHEQPVRFHFPDVAAAMQWRCLLTTGPTGSIDHLSMQAESFDAESRSITVFALVAGDDDVSDC
jgi:glycogen operon protein